MDLEQAIVHAMFIAADDAREHLHLPPLAGAGLDIADVRDVRGGDDPGFFKRRFGKAAR